MVLDLREYLVCILWLGVFCMDENVGLDPKLLIPMHSLIWPRLSPIHYFRIPSIPILLSTKQHRQLPRNL